MKNKMWEKKMATVCRLVMQEEGRKEAEIPYHRTGGLRAGRSKRWRGRKPCLLRQTFSLITTLSARASYTFTAVRKKLRDKQRK